MITSTRRVIYPRILRLPAVVVLALCSAVGVPNLVHAASASAKAGSCGADESGLKLPRGFCATVFANGIGHARNLVVAPNGVLYVNTWSGAYFGNDVPHVGGFLVALQDTAGTGKADRIERFGETVQSGGAGGTGIAIYHDGLYAEINDKIVRYTLSADSIAPQGPAVPVVTGLPLTGDHPMHPFAIDADGNLYVDVATATNACQTVNRTPGSPGKDPCTELQTRGGVWHFDANATNQAFSPAARYATGIRNAEGYGIDAAGHRIYVTQHGRDQLHTNWPDLYQAEQEATLPAEEVVLLRQGGDYGWPECYYDGVQRKLVLAPEYGGDGGRKVGPCAAKDAPVAAFPAHWGPNSMVFYDKDQFPARYRNGLFIAFHGSWNRAPYPQGGYNVVFQPLKGDRAAGKCEIFADGFAGSVRSPDKAWHRPAGLAIAPDGSLFVADDVRGRIYHIVYRGGTGADGSGAITPCPSAAAPAGRIPVVAAASLPAPEGATKAMVALGGRIYLGQVGGAPCTGCHGGDGTGTAGGPDLTANRWVWGDGGYAAIRNTIEQGVSQPKNYRAAMPPMGGAQLTAEQVSAVAAYVWGLSHRH
jgi:glucose/arabinose dehydrogenase/mono/diheme cytochrome c family protein